MALTDWLWALGIGGLVLVFIIRIVIAVIEDQTGHDFGKLMEGQDDEEFK